MAYYEAVAQIIPIILLALAFEARAFDTVRTYAGGEPNLFAAIAMLLLLVLLALGEAAALVSLAADRDTPIATGVTALAVSCGGVAVIAPLWSRQREATRGADRSAWSIAIVMVLGLVAGVTAILASLFAN